MAESMDGGCLCGRVRYRAKLENLDAYLCHCRMCQRATGSVSIALKNAKKADCDWLTPPDWFQSSPIARRSFCATCGTSLGFEYLDSENCDLTVASFDDPTGFVPRTSFGTESRHAAWIDTRDLPSQRCDEYAPLIEKWRAAGKAMPR
jgi:hypothetical protein